MKIKPKLHKTQFSNFPSFKNKQIFLHPYSHSLTHISPTYPCSLSQTHNNPSFFSLLPNPSSPNIEPNWDPTCTFPFHSHNLQNQKPPPTPFSKSTSFPDTHTKKHLSDPQQKNHNLSHPTKPIRKNNSRKQVRRAWSAQDLRTPTMREKEREK